MAMIMPISTNTTIATCSQTHVGDIAQRLLRRMLRAAGAPSNIV
jgi:hypothetical protein